MLTFFVLVLIVMSKNFSADSDFDCDQIVVPLEKISLQAMTYLLVDLRVDFFQSSLDPPCTPQVCGFFRKWSSSAHLAILAPSGPVSTFTV